MSNRPTTVIYASRRKLIGGTIATLILFGLSLFLLLREESHVAGRLIGILGIILFGGGFCLLLCTTLRNLRCRQEMVRIGDKELELYVPARKDWYRIKWEEISGVRLQKIYGQTFLLIEFHHPEERIGQEKSALSKHLMSWQERKFGAPYIISPSNLDVSSEELFDRIQKNLGNKEIESSK